MEVLNKKDERDLLDQAMALLIKVQLGNGNKKVGQTLDSITDDLDSLLYDEY
ncbi:MAG: hypothetical protein OXB96_02480 [Candidatus Kaiserbacteria bacterium]|nr:hypothetical protein [Candidatus Kaiserbacteria bacterium]